MKKIARALAAAALLTAAAGPATAHHSYAMFDNPKKQTLSGTVRALEWTNPHVWVWVNVDDGKGGTVAWGFEAQSPSELVRFFGWTRNSLSPGDKVTVDFSPLRSGRPGGALRLLTFADGRTLKTARTNPPPGSPAELAAPGPAK